MGHACSIILYTAKFTAMKINIFSAIHSNMDESTVMLSGKHWTENSKAGKKNSWW